jgi:hypothetical protein
MLDYTKTNEEIISSLDSVIERLYDKGDITEKTYRAMKDNNTIHGEYIKILNEERRSIEKTEIRLKASEKYYNDEYQFVMKSVDALTDYYKIKKLIDDSFNSLEARQAAVDNEMFYAENALFRAKVENNEELIKLYEDLIKDLEGEQEAIDKLTNSYIDLNAVKLFEGGLKYQEQYISARKEREAAQKKLDE